MTRDHLLVLFCVSFLIPSVVTQNGAAWLKKGQDELRAALGIQVNTNVAKNVIFFLGDGMGVSTVTAGRIYKGQLEGHSGEETVLSFEDFPHVALSKTYNVDKQTADSAGTATAFLCGVKANYGTLGVDEQVKRGNCTNQNKGKVTSILKWTRDEGKAAGLVTTARVTHATPAAGYAHSAERNWEGFKDINDLNLTGQCDDIAVQLIQNVDLQVIMGGGRRYFLLDNQTDPETGEINPNHRPDGRDLIQEWKTVRGSRAKYVWNKEEFDAASPADTDYLLGLFESSHMQYEVDRNKTMEPSLAEMTEKAINILKKNDKGFFLLVEAGRIDHGHHRNEAKRALRDVVALDEAVKKAMTLTNEKDTLIVVSADHSHVFNIAGYPNRGNDILGLAGFNGERDYPQDMMPKTTLVYGNGPGYGRQNLTNVDTTAHDYKFEAAVHTTDETHGGEDVAIYARGPMSHLFHGVHEQNYIAHVMAYASCVGSNKEHCDGKADDTNGSRGVGVNHFVVFVFVIWTVALRYSCRCFLF